MRGEPQRIINISHTINCSHTGHRDACELAIDFQGYIAVEISLRIECGLGRSLIEGREKVLFVKTEWK